MEETDNLDWNYLPEREKHPCEHEGCPDEYGIECRLIDEEETISYYCAEHCQENGYCYGCGNFWAGVENFDFGNGLCENCRSEESDDWEDGEFDFDDDEFSYGNEMDEDVDIDDIEDEEQW